MVENIVSNDGGGQKPRVVFTDRETEGLNMAMEELRQKMAAQRRHAWLEESAGGALFKVLKTKSGGSGIQVLVEGEDTSEETFHFGGEKAGLIKHIDADGHGRLAIRALDLQKGWWREALDGAGYTLDNLMIVKPAVFEALSSVDAKKAEYLNPKRLLTDAGIGGEKLEVAEVALGTAVEPYVSPAFRVEYGNGGGDWTNSSRLIPVGAEAMHSIFNKADPYVSAMRNVLDHSEDVKRAVMAQLARV